jgi:hypothetical protein
MQRPFSARSNGETLLLRVQQQNHGSAFPWTEPQRVECVLDLQIVAIERRVYTIQQIACVGVALV